MNQPNGSRNGHGSTAVEEVSPNLETAQPERNLVERQPALATRARQRAREEIKQNRFVIVACGLLVFGLLLFAFTSAPKLKRVNKLLSDPRLTTEQTASRSEPTSANQSLFPIMDSERTAPAESHDGHVTEQDLDRTAARRAAKTHSSLPPAGAAGSLGSIPPFGGQPWQAPPYQPGMTQNPGTASTSLTTVEREPEVKSSLIYVRKTSTTALQSPEYRDSNSTEGQFGLGLPVGSRLRARLESAASTAVRTPVLAVVEYNYERDGEIVVPAGAKAVGHIREADRSGYVRIDFDSLLMPDGSSVSIQAAATDLELRPLKGKVEGKNTGKNVLVRSLSGIGQAGALLVGRGSLNQPFSESDVIRERVSSNIGEASDEQISRLAVTSRIVVNISAGTPIYVVLEQSPKQGLAPARLNPQPAQTPNQTNLDQLRQLLQLREELSQNAAKTENAAMPPNQ